MGWAREGAVVESGQSLRRSESINIVSERVFRVEDEERERVDGGGRAAGEVEVAAGDVAVSHHSLPREHTR